MPALPTNDTVSGEIPDDNLVPVFDPASDTPKMQAYSALKSDILADAPAGTQRSRQDTIDLLTQDGAGDINFSRDGSGAGSDLRGQIRANAVDANAINNSAVSTDKIQDDAVTSAKLSAAVRTSIGSSGGGAARSRQDTIDLLVSDQGGDINFTRDANAGSSALRGTVRDNAITSAKLSAAVRTSIAATGGGGSRPTITRVLPNSSQDSTSSQRPALTVWSSGVEGEARAAIQAIASPTDGDIAFYRVSVDRNVDRVVYFLRYSSTWWDITDSRVSRARISGIVYSDEQPFDSEDAALLSAFDPADIIPTVFNPIGSTLPSQLVSGRRIWDGRISGGHITMPRGNLEAGDTVLVEASAFFFDDPARERPDVTISLRVANAEVATGTIRPSPVEDFDFVELRLPTTITSDPASTFTLYAAHSDDPNVAPNGFMFVRVRHATVIKHRADSDSEGVIAVLKLLYEAGGDGAYVPRGSESETDTQLLTWRAGGPVWHDEDEVVYDWALSGNMGVIPIEKRPLIEHEHNIQVASARRPTEAGFSINGQQHFIPGASAEFAGVMTNDHVQRLDFAHDHIVALGDADLRWRWRGLLTLGDYAEGDVVLAGHNDLDQQPTLARARRAVTVSAGSDGSVVNAPGVDSDLSWDVLYTAPRQVQADWTATQGPAVILNKPTIPEPAPALPDNLMRWHSNWSSSVSYSRGAVVERLIGGQRVLFYLRSDSATGTAPELAGATWERMT